MDAQRRHAELEAELAAKDAAIATRDARIAEFEQQVAKLTEALAALREELGKNSNNSNLPPSSDPPGKRPDDARKKRNRDKARRRKGAQKGHRGNHRALLPREQVDEVVDLFPSQCKSCWKSLPELVGPLAKRYQHTELRPIEPHTTEYRRHAVHCPHCSYKTWAKYDRKVIPASAFGPRLMSVVAMLSGVYHLSRRKTVCLMWDVLGVRISLGAVSAIEKRVSDAVEPAVLQACEHVLQAPVKHTDGTSWLQAGVTLSLWTIATSMATVFKIVANGRKETLKLLFSKRRGVLVSDRATALTFWSMDRRQVCWAHLLRKFISFSEHDGPASNIGQELLDYASVIFEYHRDYKSGKLSRDDFVAWMAPVRQQLEATLQRAVDADIDRLSGSCKDMLEHRAALWTFVERDDVEPTNNHAERELRAFVLWRKRSFGTHSQRGNHFAERLMTIAHTGRKQGINVLAFLCACCEAHRDKRAAPSLFEPDLLAV